MKNIAIIPARSGSKGLKDKNIKLLENKPLIAYSIEAALKSGIFDCVHVSTDSEEYAKISRSYGADVPFLREEKYASDTANTWDALRFVMKRYAELGKSFDTVTLLQPTSPLRNELHIQEAFSVFMNKKADSVISVCKAEHAPELCNILGEENSMSGFLDMKRVGRRQDMQQSYRLNGAIYIQKTEILMEKKELYGEGAYAYIMDEWSSVDIDCEFDFFVAEAILQYKNLTKK